MWCKHEGDIHQEPAAAMLLMPVSTSQAWTFATNGPINSIEFDKTLW